MSEWIHLCLSDLLDQDLTSYEYFQALPATIKVRARNSDIRSFQELHDFVAEQREEEPPDVL